MTSFTERERQILGNAFRHQHDIWNASWLTHRQREQAARSFLELAMQLQPLSDGVRAWLEAQVSSDNWNVSNTSMRILLLSVDPPVSLVERLSSRDGDVRGVHTTNLLLAMRHSPPSAADIRELFTLPHPLNRSYSTCAINLINSDELKSIRGIDAMLRDPMDNIGALNLLLRAWYRCAMVTEIEETIAYMERAEISEDPYVAYVLADATMYRSLLVDAYPDQRVLQLSQHPNRQIAAWACDALAKFGLHELIHPVESLLSDEDEETADLAASSAIYLGSPSLVEALLALARRYPLWDEATGQTSASGQAVAAIHSITGVRIDNENGMQLVESKIQGIQQTMRTLDPRLRYFEGEPLSLAHLRSLLLGRHQGQRDQGQWGLVSMLGTDEGYHEQYDLIHNIPAIDRWDQEIASQHSFFEPGRWYFKGRLIR